MSARPEINFRIATWKTDKETDCFIAALLKNSAVNAELYSEITESLSAKKISLVITDYHLWYNSNHAEQLAELRLLTDAPVIAWTAALNKNIIDAVFSSNKVLFVKNKPFGNTLLETLKKYADAHDNVPVSQIISSENK
jgi:hypothetical protein